MTFLKIIWQVLSSRQLINNEGSSTGRTAAVRVQGH
jgi:hypothetical protein